MKAVWYERNGASDVLHLGEMPDPTPGPGEVRVRIATSGINPSDWKRRQGLTRRMEFPQEISQLLEAGKLRHLAGPHFPLEGARQAHQAVESGAIGKVMLEVTEGV
jgi:NADPH:quinone reductase-like Zn-dependent oxidoreductase